MNETGNIIELKEIYKTFGPTCANKSIDLQLKKGEVRGLAGENGSGKSTLASIIAGINIKDSGEMLKDGKIYEPGTPIDANNNGISIVVQELGLVNTLPPDMNIILGRTDSFLKYKILDMKKIQKFAREQYERWELGPFPKEKRVEELTVENRKIIELARALSIDPDVLILDEVSQSLSHNMRSVLYKVIQKMKDDGKSVIFITHDLEEMVEVTDSITVLRDGAVVGTKESKELTADSLKSMMIGRVISGHYYRTDSEEKYDDEVVLKVQNLSVDSVLYDISFDLHKGEILGVCGLSDAGIHALGKALFGMYKKMNGEINFCRDNIYITNPRQADRCGIAYVPKDRDNEALMLQASIKENLCLPSIDMLESRFMFLNPKNLDKLSEKTRKDFEIKSTGIHQVINHLSGGNKQRVNLGRWLAKNPVILILDCPTRGVDVGVKAYIYEIMKEAKEKGVSIILISDEMPEAIGMSDEILILKDGRVADRVKRGSNFTEEDIIKVMI